MNMSTLAIELSFDKGSESRLTALLRTLSELYDRTGDSELGVRPHVTLAVFRDTSPSDIAGTIRRLAQSLQPFELNLASAKTYGTTEGVVYLEPDPCKELLAAHRECMSILGSESVLVHSYYQPPNWVPHCTVAIGVPEHRLDHILERCRDTRAHSHVAVCRVAAVSYRPTLEVCSADLGVVPRAFAVAGQSFDIRRRPATRDDLEMLFTINKVALRMYVEPTFGPWNDEFQWQLFSDTTDPTTHEVFLQDRVPIGFWSVTHSVNEIFLDRLSLLPHFQGRGIGTMLIRELMEEAKRRNVPIRLQVFPINPAQHLYVRLGFRLVRATNTHLLMEWQAGP
jgi:ribosomal protein S18 acetylase RimI-like enzyme